MVKTKKQLSVVLSLIFAVFLNFNAFCQSGSEYYEEFDNYEEFEQDYLENYAVDEQQRELPFFSELSVAAIIIGALLGAGGCTLALRKFFCPPAPQLHLRKPKQKSRTDFENDTLIG